MSDYERMKNKWCEFRFGQPEHGSGHFPIDLQGVSAKDLCYYQSKSQIAKKDLSGRIFFINLAGRHGKVFPGLSGINSSLGFLRITMSRPSRFWDPILRLKSEFSGSFTAF